MIWTEKCTIIHDEMFEISLLALWSPIRCWRYVKLTTHSIAVTFTIETCCENLAAPNWWNPNEFPYTGSYYWFAWDWFTCCQRYRISIFQKKVCEILKRTLVSAFFDTVWHCYDVKKIHFWTMILCFTPAKNISKKP